MAEGSTLRREDLRKALQRFHAIEISQMALYKTQAVLAAHEVDKRMFLKATAIESTHVENIRAALAEYGGEPTQLSVVAPVAGAVAGAVAGLSFPLALRANVALENMAMRDYIKLIAACNDKKLRKMLWSNYLDESLHAEWFKSRLRDDVDQAPLRAVLRT